MWLECASCLGLTQLVQSLELLAYLHKCNTYPGGGCLGSWSTSFKGDECSRTYRNAVAFEISAKPTPATEPLGSKVDTIHVHLLRVELMIVIKELVVC